jgi:hypothetical protein
MPNRCTWYVPEQLFFSTDSGALLPQQPAGEDLLAVGNKKGFVF